MLGSMQAFLKRGLRRRLRHFGAAALILAAWLPSLDGAEVGPARDIEQIRVFGEVWARHYAAGDMLALADLYESDAWLMTRGQPALKDRDSILEFLGRATADGGRVRIEFQNEDIRIEGDLAFLTAKWWLQLLPGDDPEAIREAGRSFLVFRRGGDGKWRIWRDIDNHTADVTVADWPES